MFKVGDKVIQIGDLNNTIKTVVKIDLYSWGQYLEFAELKGQLYPGNHFEKLINDYPNELKK